MCRKCESPLDGCTVKKERKYVYCPSRAFEIEVCTFTCENKECESVNYYDGVTDHIFNSYSGSLFHHALLNEKTNSVYRSGVTGCAFVEIKSRTYRDCGSPVDFPTQATIMSVWLQFVMLQTAWRDRSNMFIDPFCDRAIGSRIPVSERNAMQLVSSRVFKV